MLLQCAGGAPELDMVMVPLLPPDEETEETPPLLLDSVAVDVAEVALPDPLLPPEDDEETTDPLEDAPDDAVEDAVPLAPLLLLLRPLLPPEDAPREDEEPPGGGGAGDSSPAPNSSSPTSRVSPSGMMRYGMRNVLNPVLETLTCTNAPGTVSRRKSPPSPLVADTV